LAKVLFILHYPPPVHGSSVIGGVIKESRILNESFQCQYINFGTSLTVEEIGKEYFAKLSRYFSLIWKVKNKLLVFKPDLCYFSPNSKGIGFYRDALIILLVRLFGVRPVYHLHNKGVSLRQHKFFDNILYHLVFRNADVILLSKNLYPDISKYVPENRVYYCPNGIAEARGTGHRAQGAGRRVQGKNNKIVEILFVSHLIESKGIYILVDALRILNEKNIDFHCTMVGGEANVSMDQMQQKINKAGLNERITLAGKIFGPQKELAFEQADIFVHPTFNDCMPLVLLEAMQYSLPIVSTFEGAIPDVVEDSKTGFLVLQRDAVALAEKIELLIKSPELRAQMGAAGRAKYEKEFTLEIFEKRMVEILEEVGRSKK
jgi:glycosyltransferase involved in cell wall biosynthesis